MLWILIKFCYRYVNLGDIQNPPFVTDSGELKLEYQDGDLCKVRSISVPHIKTSITFKCDFEAMVYIIIYFIY